MSNKARLKRAEAARTHKMQFTVGDDASFKLPHTEIDPESVELSTAKGGRELEPTGNTGDLEKNQYRLNPETGELEFNKWAVGKKFKIEYAYSGEEAADEDESEDFDEGGAFIDKIEDVEVEDEDGAPEKEVDEEDLGEASESASRGHKFKYEEKPWQIDKEWFHWQPEEVRVVVDDSLEYTLGKHVDIRKGHFPRLISEDDGTEIKLRLDSGTSARAPNPGEALYVKDRGKIYFSDGLQGAKLRVLYYPLGKDLRPKHQSEQEEFDTVEGLRNRVATLWTRLLSNPDPEFVRDRLIPIIEDEINSVRSKSKEEIADVTEELMTLDHLLTRLENNPDDDAAREAVESHIALELAPKLVRFHNLAGLLADQVYEMQTKGLEDDDNLPDLENFLREFMIPLLEKAESVSRQKKIERSKEPFQDVPKIKPIPSFKDDIAKLRGYLETVVRGNNRKIVDEVQGYIERAVLPHLRELDAGMARHVEQEITQLDIQDLNLPGTDFAEAGVRAFDFDFLHYIDKIRREANQLDGELTDFAKYHMGTIAKLIQLGSSYNPGLTFDRSTPEKSRAADDKDKRIFDSSYRREFEKQGITIKDLLDVALDAFRDAVLRFDRSKVVATQDDPMKARITSNPMIRKAVQRALQGFWKKFEEETTQELERKQSTTFTIPNGGGTLSLESRNIIPGSVRVESEDGRRSFLIARGYPFVARKWMSGRAQINLKEDHPVGNKGVSPFSGMGGWRRKSVVLVDSNSIPWNFKAPPPNKSGEMAEFNKMIANGEQQKLYTVSDSGILALPGSVAGQTFYVTIGGAATDDKPLDKDEYRINPGKGEIEFSSKNGGEKVIVHFEHRIKTTKNIQDHVTSQGEEGEDAAVNLHDLAQGDGAASPEDQIEQAEQADRVNKLMDVVGDILDDESNGLNDADRAILQGVLGLGSEGVKLSDQEIATKPPFNLDPEDSNFAVNVSNRVKQRKKVLGPKLVELLTERLKSGKDDRLLSIVKSKAFKKLFGFDGIFQEDKFLPFFQRHADNPDFTRSLRVGLGKLLSQAGLTGDEENLLRMMWGVQGPLKDWKEFEGYIDQVKGGEPIDLSTVIETLGLDPENPEDVARVKATYRKAIEKFEPKFDQFLNRKNSEGKKVRDLMMDQEWGRDFVPNYTRQREIQRDVTESDDPDTMSDTPEFKSRQKSLPKRPLYEDFKDAVRPEDEGLFRETIEEFASEQEKGKTLAQILSEKQAILDAARTEAESRVKKIVGKQERKKVDEIRQAVEAQRKKIAKNKERIKALQGDERDALEQILSANPEIELALRRVDKEILALGKDGSEETQARLDELNEKREELTRRAVGLADGDLRKQFRRIRMEMLALQSAEDDDNSLLREQAGKLEDALDELRKVTKDATDKLQTKIKSLPEQKAVDYLSGIASFLMDRKDLARGNGKYSLENLFEVKAPEKTKGYQPPKLQPGEEDTYRPAPTKLQPGGQPQPKVKEVPAVDKGDASVVQKIRTDSDLFKEIHQAAEMEGGAGDLVGFLKIITDGMAEGKSLGDIRPALEAYDKLDKSVKRKIYAFLQGRSDLRPTPGTLDLSGLFKRPISSREAPVKPEIKTREMRRHRSLYDELLATAYPPDPEDADYSTSRFENMMRKLRDHFAGGGTLREFATNHGLGTQAPPNLPKILVKIRDYLRETAPELETSPGVWDMKNLFATRDVTDKVKDPVGPQIDKSPEEQSMEALENGQAISPEEAKILHVLLQQLETKGGDANVLLRQVSKKSPHTAEMAGRVAVLLAQHPDLVSSLDEETHQAKYDFSKVYSGEYKLPSRDEYDQKYKPLETYLAPLYKSLSEESRQNDRGEKKDGDPGISEKDAQERVIDVIEQMQTFASDGLSLDDMEAQFEQMDEDKDRPYSIAYVFQRVRNFLARLSRQRGIANMQDNKGLAPLFGEDEAGTTDQETAPEATDEVTEDSAPEESVDQESTDEEPGETEMPTSPTETSEFKKLVETQKLDDKEKRRAHIILNLAQNEMAEGKTIQEVFNDLPEMMRPVASKIVNFLRDNIAKYRIKDTPGALNLELLTGKKPAGESEGSELDDAARPPEGATLTDDVEVTLEETPMPAGAAEAETLPPALRKRKPKSGDVRRVIEQAKLKPGQRKFIEEFIASRKDAFEAMSMAEMSKFLKAAKEDESLKPLYGRLRAAFLPIFGSYKRFLLSLPPDEVPAEPAKKPKKAPAAPAAQAPAEQPAGKKPKATPLAADQPIGGDVIAKLLKEMDSALQGPFVSLMKHLMKKLQKTSEEITPGDINQETKKTQVQQWKRAGSNFLGRLRKHLAAQGAPADAPAAEEPAPSTAPAAQDDEISIELEDEAPAAPPAPPAPKAPARAPKPKAPATPAAQPKAPTSAPPGLTAQNLMAMAVKKCMEKGWDAETLGHVIQQKMPHLHEAYEKIKTKVQSALDAMNDEEFSL
jgi:hypothetical protein